MNAIRSDCSNTRSTADVGPGNIGVVVARHGIGKTAFLVGIALDDAIRGRKVLHVSLDKTVDHVREFYDEIFMDLAHSAGLEDLATARLEMERHRMIHTYAGGIVHDRQAAPFDPIPEGSRPLRAGLSDPPGIRLRTGNAGGYGSAPPTRRRIQRRVVDVCTSLTAASHRTIVASPNPSRSSPRR